MTQPAAGSRFFSVDFWQKVVLGFVPVLILGGVGWLHSVQAQGQENKEEIASLKAEVKATREAADDAKASADDAKGEAKKAADEAKKANTSTTVNTEILRRVERMVERMTP